MKNTPFTCFVNLGFRLVLTILKKYSKLYLMFLDNDDKFQNFFLWLGGKLAIFIKTIYNASRYKSMFFIQ